MNAGPLCRVRLTLGERRAEFAVALGGPCSGGPLLQPASDFAGSVVGRGEPADKYGLAQWLSGLTSGAFYAFGALQSPKRRVILHELSGSLDAEAMDALANGCVIAVARLLEREPPAISVGEWSIEATLTPEVDVRRPVASVAPDLSPDSTPPAPSTPPVG